MSEEPKEPSVLMVIIASRIGAISNDLVSCREKMERIEANQAVLSDTLSQLLLRLGTEIVLRRCANEACGKEFVAEPRNRLYCSNTCQNAATQRRFRERKKEGGAFSLK